MIFEEQRPSSRPVTIVAYLLLLILGATSFFVWAKFLPANGQSWKSHLVDVFATALITVSAFELLRFCVHSWIYRLSFRRDFDGFFGDDACSDSGKAVIILQSDDVRDLLAGSQSVTIGPKDRGFKARRWVNKWDLLGARQVTLMLRKHELDPPKVEAVEHGSDFNTYSDAPFAIAMGLGFTDNTTILTQDLPWLEISKDELNGDCVRLKQELILPKQTRFQPHEKQAADIDSDHFVKLLPKDWDVEKWAQKPDAQPDYALILRRTFVVPSSKKRQVRFALAGFTEIGTAAAGKYLADRWRDLYRRHVKGSLKSQSKGDFLVIIDGDSNIDAAWSDSNFPAVTQTRIRECLGEHFPWSESK